METKNVSTIDECREIGLSINCALISEKFIHMKRPLIWLCSNCQNKFTETIFNIKMNHRGCLKCAYKKFNYNK